MGRGIVPIWPEPASTGGPRSGAETGFAFDGPGAALEGGIGGGGPL
jgi:hypothetical protein